jgi:hypothetical protein
LDALELSGASVLWAVSCRAFPLSSRDCLVARVVNECVACLKLQPTWHFGLVPFSPEIVVGNVCLRLKAI